MRVIPVLLQPRLFAIKNRWLRSGRHGLKELVGLSFSLLMMYIIYASTLAGLAGLNKAPHSASFDPTAPLATLLAALFFIILFSAAVSALGSLFMSRDLDLTISAPLSTNEFLLGKAFDVGISVGWMICIFGFPSLLAFGVAYSAGAPFLLAAPLICLGYLALAVLLGMIISVIFAVLIPSERSKQIFIVLFMGSLVTFIFLVNGASSSSIHTLSKSSPDLGYALSEIATNPWLPSTHCARAVVALAENNLRPLFLFTLELTATLVITWVILRAIFAMCYERGLARTHATRGLVKIHSRSAQRIARLIFPFASPSTRALMAKEYKLFSRDLTHTVQLALLLGVTFVYLYNYHRLEGPPKGGDDVVAMWSIVLLLTNICLGALVVTSICSRFVFPSVSLEGSSFWLIQSAPITLKELLRAKFRSWRAPVSCIGAVIFISGAMALNAEVPLVLASCAAGVIMCHGLVGLGIGFGALFSQFEWEHSTQLSTNLGSFIFMLVSMLFLGINIIPIGLMFSTYLLFPVVPNTPHLTMLVLSSGLLITYLLNLFATWCALRAGAKALQPQ